MGSIAEHFSHVRFWYVQVLADASRQFFTHIINCPHSAFA